MCLKRIFNRLIVINDMSTNYWAIIAGEKIQPFLLVVSCYQCSNWLKLTPDHEIHLAIYLLKGISCVISHNSTGLLLFNDMSSNYWTIIAGEKIQPFLLVISCYQCSNWLELTPYHEIPLTKCLLKGISCVLSHNNIGLSLFNDMSTNYCTIIAGEKNTAFLTG